MTDRTDDTDDTDEADDTDHGPDFSALTSFLDRENVDGYLLDADSDSPDQLYLSGFDAPDPFVSLFAAEPAENRSGSTSGSAGGSIHLLVSSLEYGRARAESRAATVSRLADFDYHAKRAEKGQKKADGEVLSAFLGAHEVSSVAVPPRFPVGTADALRGEDVSVTTEYDGIVTETRATKTAAEIEHVREAQRANERALAAAESLLSASTIEEGVLRYEGEALTAERVKEEIEVTLLGDGYALDETIVACGTDAADPHNRGSGPLRANEAIVIDVFPRAKASHYHADMTRTFCKGEPGDEIESRYEITEKALQSALDAISPGVTGEAVHGAVCDVYEEAGFATLRSNDRTETGFIHGTGHGVGLAVHELPRLARGGEELEAGHVVTVEPGLYDPDVGGVRIEDLVLVTADGYENLTDYPKQLVID